MYHPTINNIHVRDIIKKYGLINFIEEPIVYGFFLFKLYIFKNPIYITKLPNNGVIPFVIDIPVLITTWANSGEIFACINVGTKTGDIIIHFCEGLVKNILAIATNNSETINDINKESEFNYTVNNNIIYIKQADLTSTFKYKKDCIYDTDNPEIKYCLKKNA